MSCDNCYDLGDVVRLSALFKVSNTPTDPTTVVFKIRLKATTIHTYTYGTNVEVVRDGVGAYHLDYTPALAGTYYYRIAGTGAAQAAEECQFEIRRSRF